MTDQELLHAYARACDVDCLDTFVRRYQDSLTRFASRFLGDPEAAQDVVQETFIQVARNPRRLQDVQNCHNWLLKVARNIGISRIRHNARVRKHTEAFARRVAADSAQREEAAGPKALEAEELRVKVRGEIDRLNPRHREVLLLKIQEDKSYREISEITGLSITYVGYILHQAMKELSRRLNHSKEDFT